MDSSQENWSPEALFGRLSGLSATLETSAPAVSDLRWRYREAAAVLSYFDPRTLKPTGADAPHGAAETHLKDDIAPASALGEHGWILSANVRKQALQRLRTREAMRGALEMNRARSPDSLQQSLDAYILGTAPPLNQLSVEELRSASKVVDWLRGLPLDLPSRAQLRRRIDWVTWLQPFRDKAETGRFFGRRLELERLLGYLTAPPVNSLYEKPPLFIHGPGGIGKSTLLARFILTLTERDEPSRLSFVFVDFDLPGSIGDPFLVITDAARQLAYQHPDASDGWNDLRSRWSERLASLGQTLPAGGARARALTLKERGQLLREFRDTLGGPDRRLLFAIDSFSEVQHRRDAFVDELWRLLNELQALCPAACTMMSGRELPGEFPTQELQLSGLDPSATEELMEALGATDLDQARAIADRVNGNPLTMRLAAEVIGGGGLFRGSKDFIQGTLYRMLLAQIRDPDVRQLGQYGLVPRQLTPDVISSVLADACEVNVGSPQRAVELFEDLRRELRLARRGSDGSVRHPPDVRRAILEFLRREDPERVELIHRRAVVYYSRQAGSDNRAEELYHRLSLGEEPPRLGGLEDSYESLRASVSDLPASGQKYLAGLLGMPLDQAILARADAAQWERRAWQEARELLARDQPGEALERVRERSERSPASPLFLLEGHIRQRLRQTTEAREIVQEGLALTAQLGDSPVLVDLLIFLAELDDEASMTALAAESLEQAYAVARRLHDQERLVDVGVRRLRLGGFLGQGSGAPTDLTEDITTAFLRIRTARLARKPDLIRQVATALGETHPDVLKRAVRLAGLPRLETTQIDTLSELLANWKSEAASSSWNEAAAGLAGRPSPGSSKDRWREYLPSASASDLSELVAVFLDSGPPQGAISIVARLVSSVPGSGHRLAESLPPAAAVLLTAHQKEMLRNALFAAFPDEPAVQELLQYEMDNLTLESVDQGGTLPDKLRDLISWAIRHDRLPELVLGAVRRKGDNPALRDTVRRIPVLRDLVERGRE
jgi:cellulose synthase operon protein C